MDKLLNILASKADLLLDIYIYILLLFLVLE